MTQTKTLIDECAAAVATAVGLTLWLAGLLLAGYAWLAHDDGLQRFATMLMCLLLPCLFLAAFCLDRHEDGGRHE